MSAYSNNSKKISQFTKGTAITDDVQYSSLQNGVNKTFTQQQIIDDFQDVYGASLRTFEFESELVASDIAIGEYAIVEENNYSFYKITNSSAVLDDVELTSGLVATFQHPTARLKFDSVSDMKLRSLEAGTFVTTDGYYGKKTDGGAKYLIKTAAEAATDGDTIDEYGNVTLANGNIAILQVDAGIILLSQMGWTEDAVNDSSKISGLLDFIASKDFVELVVDGDYEVSSSIDLSRDREPDVYSKLIIRGVERTQSTIYTNSDISIFIIDNRTHFRNFSIEQRSGNHEGIGIRTRLTNQMLWCSFEEMEINGFKFGQWARFSVWCTWKNVNFNENLCGMKLSRNNDPDDVTNPIASDGWNDTDSNGWFHNQGVLDNVLFDEGEVGFFGCPMGFVFNACTAQGQRENTSESILPAGVAATGFYIDSGDDSAFNGWGNVFNGCYTEFTDRPFAFHGQRYAHLNGCFVQGGDTGARYETPIYCTKSNVYIDGMTGQDFFTDKCILENDSNLYGDPAGAYSGVPSQVDATSSWFRFTQYANYIDSFTFSKPSGATHTVTPDTTLSSNSIYKVSVLMLRNGSSVRTATYTVSRWNNDANTNVDLESGTEAGFSASVSGGQFVLSIGDTLSWSGRIIIEKLSDFTTYNQKTITPV